MNIPPTILSREYSHSFTLIRWKTSSENTEKKRLSCKTQLEPNSRPLDRQPSSVPQSCRCQCLTYHSTYLTLQIPNFSPCLAAVVVSRPSRSHTHSARFGLCESGRVPSVVGCGPPPHPSACYFLPE